MFVPRLPLLLALTVVAIAVSACAADDPRLDGPPVGEALLPDLVPDPPKSLRTHTDDEGREWVLFSSILTNVGDGDFLLDGGKAFDQWTVTQTIGYSESGSTVMEVPAEMAWGGDGHEHWHVSRVAVNWLQALDDNGDPDEGFEWRYDSKIGFCFYDSHHNLDYGPKEFQYDASGCGLVESLTFSVGLSRGWSDVYDFTLPGQEVEVTGLPDGMYRLWSEADPEGWFREASKENNVSWVDFELSTRESDGARLALVTKVGPQSSDY